jgi:hypothetical protein
MNHDQAIYLANRFMNLDIKYCDPDVWYPYMLDKRPEHRNMIMALNALLHVNNDVNNIDMFYQYMKNNQLEDEVYELLHAIPDDPTLLQYDIFHYIEDTYQE